VVRRAAFEKPPPWPIDEFVAMQDADRDSVESPRSPPSPPPPPPPPFFPSARPQATLRRDAGAWTGGRTTRRELIGED